MLEERRLGRSPSANSACLLSASNGSFWICVDWEVEASEDPRTINILGNRLFWDAQGCNLKRGEVALGNNEDEVRLEEIMFATLCYNRYLCGSTIMCRNWETRKATRFRFWQSLDVEPNLDA